MIIDWIYETRKLKDLREFPKNPRQIKKQAAERLDQGISKFGLAQPISITQDGLIIGGHQRYKLLKKKKIKECIVAVAPRELTEKEIEELNITLNKISGEFDDDILANEWDIEDLIEYGFSLDELDLAVPEEKCQDDRKLKIEIKCEDEIQVANILAQIEPILLENIGVEWKRKK